MKVKTTNKIKTDVEYYDKRGVLDEISDEDVALSLDEALRKDILSGKRKRKSMKKRSKSASCETDEELSPQWKRELRRRIADVNDPVRYAVFSDIAGLDRWRLWLNVFDDTYGMSLDQATLFKRKAVAQAAAKAASSGREGRLRIARITTKNGKRRVLRYE